MVEAPAFLNLQPSADEGEVNADADHHCHLHTKHVEILLVQVLLDDLDVRLSSIVPADLGAPQIQGGTRWV